MRVCLPEVIDPRMVWCKLRVQRSDMVLVRAIIEASEGIACMHSHWGGELMLVACESQRTSFNEILNDLRMDFGAVIFDSGVTSGTSHESIPLDPLSRSC